MATSFIEAPSYRWHFEYSIMISFRKYYMSYYVYIQYSSYTTTHV